MTKDEAGSAHAAQARGTARAWLGCLLVWVLVFLLASTGWTAEPRPSLVCMSPTDLLSERDGTEILLIEMQRQAVLMVAREDFGAFTRDQTCGEPMPADTAEYGQVLELNAVVSKPKLREITTTLTSRQANGKEQRLEIAVTVPRYSLTTMYQACAEATDRLSLHEIPSALRQLGLQPATRPASGVQPVPAVELEMALGEMSYFSQYEVLRQAHAMLLQQADSPELLSIVARAYAHLGQLTRCHYDGSGKVFAARSLLYAQRLIRKHPEMPEAMWTRAYVAAIAGIHVQAMADLRRADKLAGAKVRPAWASAAEMLCEFDTKGLAALGAKAPEVREAAQFMAFMTVEASGSPMTVIGTTKSALESSPFCFRLLDGACAEAGVGGRHELTEAGFPAMVAALRTELPKMRGLPLPIRQAGDAALQDANLPRGVAALANAMVQLTTPCEPSLAMLGNMVQQTNFLHVYTRAYFMAFQWSVNPDEYLAEVAPLFQNHPLRALVDACSEDARQSDARQTEILSRIDARFWSPKLASLAADSAQCNVPGKMTGVYAMRMFCARVDNVAYDAEPVAIHLNRYENRDWAHRKAQILTTVSPRNPAGPSLLLLWNLDGAGEKADDFIKQYPDSVLIIASIARRNMGDKNYAVAAKMWERYVAMAPEPWAFRLLADCRVALGDSEGGVAAHKQVMAQEDYALDHAAAGSEIARLYMEQGKYEQALPYAEAAAESWAEWAMRCAAECNERLDHWQQAETWYQRIAERYDEPSVYYSFCVRTGRGDKPAALAAARRQAATLSNESDREKLVDVAVVQYLEGESDAALSTLEKSATRYGDPWAALLAAIMRDGRGEAAQRDQLLADAVKSPTQEIQQRPTLYRPWLRSMASQMQSACSDDPKAPLEPAALEKLLAEADRPEQANIRYIAGMFLLQRGHDAAGIKLLRDCAASPELSKTAVTMAVDALRRRGLLTDPGESPTSRPDKPATETH